MMIKVHDFAKRDPLLHLTEKTIHQILYIHDYLADLGATSVLEEKAYFDQNYMAEFTAFYAASARGYRNVCRRLHYFSGSPITERHLKDALGGKADVIERLQDCYLGFVVLRPVESAPLGRTVLRWYEDKRPFAPRVTQPIRKYEVHLGGLTLSVKGLAWQQQDSAVGACATVALWSMLQSSAFADYHPIPTTADITRFAHRTASLGSRVFPSRGLRLEQVLEAIKESGLAPVLVDGEEFASRSKSRKPVLGFKRERFASTCAALIRAGYAVLALGELEGEGLHAVCITGFRSAADSRHRRKRVAFEDEGIEYFYLHDDNLGPNIRFKVEHGGSHRPTQLIRSVPISSVASEGRPSTDIRPTFTPQRLIAAVHESIRIYPAELNEAGLLAAHKLLGRIPGLRLTVSSRFARLSVYLGEMLEQVLGGPGGDPGLLARTRLRLMDLSEFMSSHLGLVRIGFDDIALLDIVYDTTDNWRREQPICHVAYHSAFASLTKVLKKRGVADFGDCVEAFRRNPV